MNLPLMLLDDPVGDRKAQTGAVVFFGEEGVEDVEVAPSQ